MMQWLTGLVLVLATWLALRRMVGAAMLGRPGPGRVGALLLDALAPFVGFFLFVLPTARPIMAGLGVACLGIGLAIADRVKRKVLDEPVVFADRAELIEVVRHPRLYLAFVGMGRMIAATVAALVAIVLLVRLEPPLWPMSLGTALLLALLAAAIGRALFVLPTRPNLLRRLDRAYARLQPVREPFEDARRFGLLASCIIHATIARAERPARQHAAQARSWPEFAAAGPIVIVQGESFVDAARLDPALSARLPHFARLRREARLSGLLTVPCWGANTIRSELAVLTGLGTEAIGLDRFNPYEHFAHVPLPSLASAARAAGYRTICLHPYNPGFYARDKVMPLLGFDRFIGIEGFADAPRCGPYVSDVAVAERAAELVRRHGPKVLVFAITMENHGPWDAEHDPLLPAELPADWRDRPDAVEIGRWLRHLDSTDAMIPILRDAVGDTGWLLFYGDHQPSLSRAFHVAGAPDRRTDYAIWRANGQGGAKADLPAEEVAAALLSVMREDDRRAR